MRGYARRRNNVREINLLVGELDLVGFRVDNLILAASLHCRLRHSQPLPLQMLSLTSASFSFAPMQAPVVSNARASVAMETKADLEALAVACNPIVGFWSAAPLHA